MARDGAEAGSAHIVPQLLLEMDSTLANYSSHVVSHSQPDLTLVSSVGLVAGPQVRTNTRMVISKLHLCVFQRRKSTRTANSELTA